MCFAGTKKEKKKGSSDTYELCNQAESEGLWAPTLQDINHGAFHVMNCF